MGSSPLARGLPLVGEGSVYDVKDHPRSRGVYRGDDSVDGRVGGSSPLARGLPAVVLMDIVIERIIPARAGFTNSRPLEDGANQDHPRSRGVYSQTFKDIFISCGSSPLARGLRVALIGIWMTVVDHPRSRGVYGIITNLQDNPAGSSPLARGLPGATGSPHSSH